MDKTSGTAYLVAPAPGRRRGLAQWETTTAGRRRRSASLHRRSGEEVGPAVFSVGFWPETLCHSPMAAAEYQTQKAERAATSLMLPR